MLWSEALYEEGKPEAPLCTVLASLAAANRGLRAVSCRRSPARGRHPWRIDSITPRSQHVYPEDYKKPRGYFPADASEQFEGELRKTNMLRSTYFGDDDPVLWNANELEALCASLPPTCRLEADLEIWSVRRYEAETEFWERHAGIQGLARLVQTRSAQLRLKTFSLILPPELDHNRYAERPSSNVQNWHTLAPMEEMTTSTVTTTAGGRTTTVTTTVVTHAADGLLCSPLFSSLEHLILRFPGTYFPHDPADADADSDADFHSESSADDESPPRRIDEPAPPPRRIDLPYMCRFLRPLASWERLHTLDLVEAPSLALEALIELDFAAWPLRRLNLRLSYPIAHTVILKFLSALPRRLEVLCFSLIWGLSPLAPIFVSAALSACPTLLDIQVCACWTSDESAAELRREVAEAARFSRTRVSFMAFLGAAPTGIVYRHKPPSVKFRVSSIDE